MTVEHGSSIIAMSILWNVDLLLYQCNAIASGRSLVDLDMFHLRFWVDVIEIVRV